MKTLLLLALLGGCCTLGHACSCFADTSADDYCTFDLIFLGTAFSEYKQRKRPIDPKDPWSVLDINAEWVYTFQVDKILWAKESPKAPKTVTIRTPVEDSMCGFQFALHKKFIVFARLYDGAYTTGLCDHNALWCDVDKGQKQKYSSLFPNYCAQYSKKN
ncbi:metalloproteinase inhibitor 3-like [Pomacea canaliculata]|uniref:metalloproteinase inhibitor 3-like n=1 Tax=Pomacea canaliculata TaxID=400727 RepID=UPI000D728681|nr:metalloproteinase inhibitor 3-like [Pomacea canaliculata]